jgi:hypothetical protein
LLSVKPHQNKNKTMKTEKTPVQQAAEYAALVAVAAAAAKLNAVAIDYTAHELRSPALDLRRTLETFAAIREGKANQ